MVKLSFCLLALAACGLPDKHHCAAVTDCFDGEACRDGVCQPATSDACGPMRTKCSTGATCADTPDGLACACLPGFIGDGIGCSDLDECAATPSPCSPQASCGNTPGSFACTCLAGFVGDGSYCVPQRFAKIAAGSGFSCGLSDAGEVYCWGDANGALDFSVSVPHAHPLRIGTASNWIDIGVHADIACGLQADHSMWCWGRHQATGADPTRVDSDKPGIGWRAMAVGVAGACGLHDDGSLACWGAFPGAPPLPTVVAVDTNTDWTDLATGGVTCGIRGAPGLLYCWGGSSDGELGLGDITEAATPTPVGTDTWNTVRVGAHNACGIRSDGALLCWGNNPFTRTALQYGSTPRVVGTATDWQALSVSSASIFGLRAGGHGYAWGANGGGQLGLTALTEVEQPTEISGTVTGWRQLSAAPEHGCGIAGDQAYCWGTVGAGRLGDGASTTLFRPMQIGSERWTAVAGGAGTCGLRSDGALLCWGHTPGFGVGLGTTDPVWAPARIGSDTWTAVAGSFDFGAPATCAIRDGVPYCWGDNSSGQLGIGNAMGPALVPTQVAVPPATRWTEIAVSDHTCAIQRDATLWCWGANDAGQLGTGATSKTPTFIPLAPLPGAWLHVAVARIDPVLPVTCGIKTDHTLWCWGADRGLGFNDLVPTQIGSEAAWASLSIGSLWLGPKMCALKLDGTLWCWGSVTEPPVQVGTDRDWKTVAVGGEICAIKTGGTLWCWAANFVLGNGFPVTDILLLPDPVQIGSDTDWSTVVTDAGGGSTVAHDPDGAMVLTEARRASKSCALKRDGTLWCWGWRAGPVPDIVTTPVPLR